MMSPTSASSLRQAQCITLRQAHFGMLSDHSNHLRGFFIMLIIYDFYNNTTHFDILSVTPTGLFYYALLNLLQDALPYASTFILDYFMRRNKLRLYPEYSGFRFAQLNILISNFFRLFPTIIFFVRF